MLCLSDGCRFRSRISIPWVGRFLWTSRRRRAGEKEGRNSPKTERASHNRPAFHHHPYEMADHWRGWWFGDLSILRYLFNLSFFCYVVFTTFSTKVANRRNAFLPRSPLSLSLGRMVSRFGLKLWKNLAVRGREKFLACAALDGVPFSAPHFKLACYVVRFMRLMRKLLDFDP